MIIRETAKPPFAIGKSQFKIMNAVEKHSKSGNPMIELTLKLWDAHGTTSQCRSWLVATAPWIIRQFAKSAGIDELPAEPEGLPGVEENQQPTVEYKIEAHDCIGRTGECMTKLQDDFVSLDRFGLPANLAQNEPLDDDIPFG